jgi:hypothetical protein
LRPAFKPAAGAISWGGNSDKGNPGGYLTLSARFLPRGHGKWEDKPREYYLNAVTTILDIRPRH